LYGRSWGLFFYEVGDKKKQDAEKLTRNRSPHMLSALDRQEPSARAESDLAMP
jgi:hypothetical protein